MELIAFIAFCWIVGCLFPGSGQSYGPELAVVLAGIVSIVLVLAFFTAIIHAAVFVGDWTGSAWVGVATFLILLFGTLIGNRLFWDWRDRRNVVAHG